MRKSLIITPRRVIMDKSSEECLSLLKVFERLVKLETEFSVSSCNSKEALEMARNLLEKDTKSTKEIIDTKLQHLNQLREEVIEDRAIFVRNEIFNDLREKTNIISNQLTIYRSDQVKLENNIKTIEKDIRDILKANDLFLKKETYEIKASFYDTWSKGVDKKLAYLAGGLSVFVVILQILFRVWK
jgi:hypothetical protein